MYYLHCFSKKQPDLNWENPVVRDEVFNMMTWWCEKGVDGFRMDVISMISKDPAYPDGEIRDGLHGDMSPYVCNGPHVHEYLQEMNQRVLSKFDLITVGETPGVTTEEAKKYANLDGSELNMVFQFEHMGTTDGKYGKWTTKKPEMKKVRAVMNKWQNDLEGKAWNSLYWDNHDQPRAVSRFGDDSPMYREVSAKMIATCLHMLKGSPYIYQGEEIGMTNAYFKSIDDYKDIEAINAYKEYTESGLMTEEEMLNCLKMVSRDNARTPMQWNTSSNAGFTTGIPWLRLNDNYPDVNVAAQEKDTDSVLNYYKKLIALRKSDTYKDIFTYGKTIPVFLEKEMLMAYCREKDDKRILVLGNFGEKKEALHLSAEPKKLLLSNMNHTEIGQDIILAPQESAVVLL